MSLYLFRCDGPAGCLVDTGWPNSGYQYWKNIEAIGFDPRDIDCVLMPHGHLDHYGTTVELVTMIENAGGTGRAAVTARGRHRHRADAVGNSWNLPGDLPASQTLIRERTRFFDYDQWLDFGNVRINAAVDTRTHGRGRRRSSTTSQPRTSEPAHVRLHGRLRMEQRKILTATNGWRRLGFAYSLAWLQQTRRRRLRDPQHANQYPIVEVNQALMAYNNDPANRGRRLTMLDALTPGEFVN